MDARHGAGLRRLSELDDYQIEEGYPDIRGWTLYDEAGRNIGKVKELLVDTAHDEVTYATIDLDDKTWLRELFDDDEGARVPVTALTFDEDDSAVRLTRPLGSIAGAESGDVAPADVTAPRHPTEDDAVEVVEERLDVEKSRRKAGEVRIGTEIETETVRREVPVEREEVIVEREAVEQPISAAEADRKLEGRAGEISVPVYREELEVTKRPVVTERLRIRKRSVQDTREVAAELRKERPTVEGEGAVAREGGPAGTAPGEVGPESERGRTPPRR